MNKKYALTLAFLLTGLIASNLFLFNKISKKSSREAVIVARVIDGDTIQLEDGRIIRLLNINSPEKGIYGAEFAVEFLKYYENKTLELEITGLDKYSRNLARIYNSDYLNLKIVEQGFASKFMVDSSELPDFEAAELTAIRNEMGMWKKSSYFNCFDSKIDAKNEIVFLKNLCPDIELSEWLLKDESRKLYTFKNIKLNEKKQIILHSEIGEDNETDIFWNSKQETWNNDRDSLYLFDDKGRIAHYETYGY